ncbi:MAG TPA: phage portal protein [Desulfobacterales bacterium]|nr:phage portal protein [Desulfobacterales bacterium]
MSFTTVLDNALETFLPKRAFYRQFYRDQIKKVAKKKSSRNDAVDRWGSRYAAASTTRLTGAWSPVDSSVNKLISDASATVRARVRQLVRDFPYFTRAVNLLTDYVVSDGMKFQSRIKNPDGKLNKPVSQKIEDSFNFWADEADVAKKLHYYEMDALSKTQDLECGEFLFIKRYRKGEGRYLPYVLQMIESDWLTDMGTKLGSSENDIDQGIEYKKTTGEIVAYHFTDPDSWGSVVREPAESVIHGFKTLRPGQRRGISPFVPAILVAHDLNEYMDAEMDAAKMAAKYLAIVKTPDPASRQAGFDTDPNTGKKIEELENAIIEYLRPGEDIEIASNPRPGTNFPPFVKLILTMLGITVGVPYELLSGDYQGLNYSTGQIVRNDFAYQLRPIAVRHVRHFAQRSFVPFMDHAVMNGKLDLPGYYTNPTPYLQCAWQPPGMEPIDHLRTAKAQIEQVHAGLRSPIEIVGARGRDLEDVYNEIEIAKEMAKDHKLDFSEKPDTAMANNPAALGA